MNKTKAKLESKRSIYINTHIFLSLKLIPNLD